MIEFSFFQNVLKVIQTLVFNQGTKSLHFSFVGMPLCGQRLKLFPVVQHFIMSPVVILPFLSLSPSDTHPSSNPKHLMLSGVSLLAVSNVNNPIGLVGLPYVMWSAHFFVTHTKTKLNSVALVRERTIPTDTHTDGKDKLLG